LKLVLPGVPNFQWTGEVNCPGLPTKRLFCSGLYFFFFCRAFFFSLWTSPPSNPPLSTYVTRSCRVFWFFSGMGLFRGCEPTSLDRFFLIFFGSAEGVAPAVPLFPPLAFLVTFITVISLVGAFWRVPFCRFPPFSGTLLKARGFWSLFTESLRAR